MKRLWLLHLLVCVLSGAQAQWNTILQTSSADEIQQLAWSRNGSYLLARNEKEVMVCDALSGLKVKHLIPRASETFESILPSENDSQFFLITHYNTGLMHEVIELKRFASGINTGVPLEVMELNALMKQKFGDTIIYDVKRAFMEGTSIYMHCTFYGRNDVKSIYSNYMYGVLVFDVAHKNIVSCFLDDRSRFAMGFGLVQDRITLIQYEGNILSFSADGVVHSDKVKAEILGGQFIGDTAYCVVKDASLMKLVFENGQWKEAKRIPPPFSVWPNDLDGHVYPFCVNAKGEVMIKFRNNEGLRSSMCTYRQGRWKTESCEEDLAPIAMHPSGKFCVSATRNSLEAWTTGSPTLIPGYMQLKELTAFDKVAVAGDQHLLLAASHLNGLYAFSLDKIYSRLISADFIHDIAVHPSEQFMYASHGGDITKLGLHAFDTLQRMRLWPAERNDMIPGGNYNLSISADGRYLLSQYSREHKIAVWDCSTNALLHVVPLNKSTGKGSPVVYDLALNADGSYALVKTGNSYDEDAYQLIDIRTEKIVRSFPWEDLRNEFNAFFIGNDSLVVGTHIFTLHDMKDQGELRVLKEVKNSWFRPVTMVPYKGALYYSNNDTLFRLTIEKETIEKLTSCGPSHTFTFDAHTGNLYAIREGVSIDVYQAQDHIASLYCKPVHSWEKFRPGNRPHLTYCWLDAGGNFTGDKEAFNLIAYQQGSNTIPSHQVEYEYNRGDVLLKYLAHAGTENVELYRKLYEKRKSFAMPKMPSRISSPVQYTFPVERWNPLNYFDWKGKIQYTMPEDGMQMKVLLNGIPLEASQYTLEQQGREGSLKCNIHLSFGLNQLYLEPLNARNEIISPRSVFLYNNFYLPRKTLVIGLGVSEYLDSAFNLKYPVRDVNSIVQLFRLDTNSIVKAFTNRSVTSHVLDSVLLFINSYKGDNDIENIVLFYAGHGLVDSHGNYFLATSDIDFKKPELKGLSYDTLEQFLARIPYRNKLVLLDACNSGLIDKKDIAGASNAGANTKEGRGSALLGVPDQPADFMEILEATYSNSRFASGAYIIGASGGLQYALESSRIQHGYFTYSILEAYAGYADANANGYIQAEELKDYVNRRVEQLSGGKQKPSSRAGNALNNFTLIDKKRYLIDQYFDAARNNNVNRINALAQYELINPNITDPENGFTALHYAAREDAPLAIWYLIDAGANPLQGSASGWTPLDLAVINNHYKSVVMLLSETRSGYTAEALKRAELNTKDEAMKKLLRASPAIILQWRTFHRYVFSIRNQEPVDSLFMEDITPFLSFNTTAIPVSLLTVAVLVNHMDAAVALLNKGAPVNDKMGAGYTALMYAVYTNNEGMVKLLLAHGADPGIAADNGQTAMDEAKRKGREAVLPILEEYLKKK